MQQPSLCKLLVLDVGMQWVLAQVACMQHLARQQYWGLLCGVSHYELYFFPVVMYMSTRVPRLSYYTFLL